MGVRVPGRKTTSMSIPGICNPLGLTSFGWLSSLVATQLGLSLLDRMTMCWASSHGSSKTGGSSGHVWSSADTGRVVLNMFILQIFIMQCVELVTGWPIVETRGSLAWGALVVRTIAGVYAL